MSILAIDPGFRHTGYAVIGFKAGKPVILKHGCINTEKATKRTKVRVADDTVRCVQEIVRALSGLIRDNAVRGIVAELPTGGGKSANANKSMGIATAVCGAVAVFHELPAEWVTPSEIKKALTNKRNASKDEVQRAILDEFPGLKDTYIHAKGQYKGKIRNDFEHVADAVGAYKVAENGSLIRMVKSYVAQD